jgi:hypothetical protein
MDKTYYPILTVGAGSNTEDSSYQKLFAHIHEPNQSPQNVGLLLSIIAHAFLEIIPESEQLEYLKKIKNSFTKNNREFYNNIISKVHTLRREDPEE